MTTRAVNINLKISDKNILDSSFKYFLVFNLVCKMLSKIPFRLGHSVVSKSVLKPLSFPRLYTAPYYKFSGVNDKVPGQVPSYVPVSIYSLNIKLIQESKATDFMNLIPKDVSPEIQSKVEALEKAQPFFVIINNYTILISRRIDLFSLILTSWQLSHSGLSDLIQLSKQLRYITLVNIV